MVDDRARALQDLRGLVGRLETAPSISVRDAGYLAQLVGDLGYEMKAGLVIGYHTEGQYGNVVAVGRNVILEEDRRAMSTGPASMWRA